MGQKSQYDALSFRFSRKNLCSHAYILSKKPPFSKKHNVLIPIFNQKIVHSLKNTVFSCHFFNFFFKKPTAVMPIFGKKRQFCQNYTILWAKKVNRMPFFLIFREKTKTLMPIFCQPNVHSIKNTLFSCPYFVKKRPFFQKHRPLK